MNRPGADPGSKDYRHAVRKPAEGRRHIGRDMTYSEGGYHQAIGLLRQRLGEPAIIAQRDCRDAYPHPPRGIRMEGELADSVTGEPLNRSLATNHRSPPHIGGPQPRTSGSPQRTASAGSR